MKKKYETLAELRDAFASGELSKETATMMIDNDDTTVTWHAADDPDWERAEDVFKAHPHNLLLEALTLLGIPWEYC